MCPICASLLVLGLWAPADEKPEPKPRPKFTLGKETTRATEPLDKDGYIDYADALNRELGKGITPKGNANVLLWQAFGPKPDGRAMPPEFFKWLGIEGPPEKGDYFVGLTHYLSEDLRLEVGKERETVY